MTIDELFPLLPKEGWLEYNEARLLWDVASATRGAILEVGTFHGRSTVLLGTVVKQSIPSRPVYAVDPFAGFNTLDPTGSRAEECLAVNLKHHDLSGCVQVFRQRIEDWQPLPCGFAYLDGDHDCAGTMRQIRIALRCGVTDLCLHDYENNGGGCEIVKAVKASPLNMIQVAGRMAHCRPRIGLKVLG